jgi:hypothetical protein
VSLQSYYRSLLNSFPWISCFTIISLFYLLSAMLFKP